MVKLAISRDHVKIILIYKSIFTCHFSFWTPHNFLLLCLEISQGVLFVGREIVSLFEKDHFDSFRMTILHSWLPLQIPYVHFFMH